MLWVCVRLLPQEVGPLAPTKYLVKTYSDSFIWKGWLYNVPGFRVGGGGAGAARGHSPHVHVHVDTNVIFVCVLFKYMNVYTCTL